MFTCSLIAQSTNFSGQSNMADLTYEQDANLNKNGLLQLIAVKQSNTAAIYH